LAGSSAPKRPTEKLNSCRCSSGGNVGGVERPLPEDDEVVGADGKRHITRHRRLGQRLRPLGGGRHHHRRLELTFLGHGGGRERRGE
jgi:hypothetical protein